VILRKLADGLSVSRIVRENRVSAATVPRTRERGERSIKAGHSSPSPVSIVTAGAWGLGSRTDSVGTVRGGYPNELDHPVNGTEQGDFLGYGLHTDGRTGSRYNQAKYAHELPHGFRPNKNALNIKNHCIDPSFGNRVITDPIAIEAMDDCIEYGEERWHVLGVVDGFVYRLTYKDAEEWLR